MNKFFIRVFVYVGVAVLNGGLAARYAEASSVTERYLAAIEHEAQQAKLHLNELAALLDVAKEHHGFITGDFWNIPSELYTEETYRHITNTYPFDRHWRSAIERPSGALGQHAANYRRVINGVELIPVKPSHIQNSRGFRDAFRGFPALGKGDPSYLAANTTQLHATFRYILPQRLQQAALLNLTEQEQQQFLQGLEQSVQPIIDIVFSRIFEQGIDALYRGRVIYSALAKAESAKVGLFNCLTTAELFLPAEHRARLAACDNKRYLSDMFSAYKIEFPRAETEEAKKLFFSEDVYIYFELQYQSLGVRSCFLTFPFLVEAAYLRLLLLRTVLVSMP